MGPGELASPPAGRPVRRSSRPMAARSPTSWPTASRRPRAPQAARSTCCRWTRRSARRHVRSTARTPRSARRAYFRGTALALASIPVHATGTTLPPQHGTSYTGDVPGRPTRAIWLYPSPGRGCRRCPRRCWSRSACRGARTGSRLRSAPRPGRLAYGTATSPCPRPATIRSGRRMDAASSSALNWSVKVHRASPASGGWAYAAGWRIWPSARRRACGAAHQKWAVRSRRPHAFSSRPIARCWPPIPRAGCGSPPPTGATGVSCP